MDLRYWIYVWKSLPAFKLLYKIFTAFVVPRLWKDLWYRNTGEDRFLAFVKKTATKGDAVSVLAAIEKYNQEHEFSIMLDADKREKVEEVVKKVSPKVCFDMGCYIGCSSIAVGHMLPAGGRLITAELDPRIADVARQIIEFAGLDQVITVVTGKSSDVIKELRGKYSVDKLDFVFIDHEPKSLYLPDLKLLEENTFLRKGTVVMADNTLWPGAPDFLQHVENPERYETERVYSLVPVWDELDVLTISVFSGDN